MLAGAIHPLLAVLAAGLSAAGAVGVFAAWRRRRAAHGVLLACGWGALALSLPVWAFAAGPDRGLALGVLAAMIAVGAILAAQHLRGGTAAARSPRRLDSTAAGARLSLDRTARTLVVTVLAAPVAFAAAAFLSAILYAGVVRLGAPQPDALLASLLLLPLAWGGLAAIAGLDVRLRVRAGGLVAAAALSGAALAALAAAG